MLDNDWKDFEIMALIISDQMVGFLITYISCTNFRQIYQFQFIATLAPINLFCFHSPYCC